MTGPVSPAVIKGHCPSCGPGRSADVVGHHMRRQDDDDNGVWGVDDYRILQCRGCGDVYFQIHSIFSEDWDHRVDPYTGKSESFLIPKITHWPEPAASSERTQPQWTFELYDIDSGLHSLFSSIYVAVKNELWVLSAIGIRTVFDQTSEILGIDPAKTFSEKLSDLFLNGMIGESERRLLEILTDAGSAAAHRRWKPTPKEIHTMIDLIEQFIYRNFILHDAAQKIKQGIPEKLTRRKM